MNIYKSPSTHFSHYWKESHVLRYTIFLIFSNIPNLLITIFISKIVCNETKYFLFCIKNRLMPYSDKSYGTLSKKKKNLNAERFIFVYASVHMFTWNIRIYKYNNYNCSFSMTYITRTFYHTRSCKERYYTMLRTIYEAKKNTQLYIRK